MLQGTLAQEEKERDTHCAKGSALEALMAECVQRLCMPREFGEAVTHVLERLGERVSASRTYLYRLSPDGWSLEYEWRAAGGVAPAGEGVWPCGAVPTWPCSAPLLLEQLEPMDALCPSLGALLTDAGAVSAAIVPLGAEGETVGCLGVDNPAPGLLCAMGPLMQVVACSVMGARRFTEDARALERMSLYDGLTGAFHRGSYLQALESVVAEQEPLGIARYQITGMRSINERMGYACGDELLVSCARRALEALSSEGRLYRVGCDEFAVICLGMDREAFEALSVRLCGTLEENAPCSVLAGYQWTARARTALQLDLAAEAMMEEERQRYERLKTLSSRQRIPAEDPFGMLTDEKLTNLLLEGRFIVYLQPKLSFQDSTLVGAEALVRFLDGSAIVEPGRFLPDLEASFLIKYLDLYVFEQACCLISRWQRGASHIYTPISVNFSKTTLEEPNLVTRLLHLCRRHNVEPGSLEVEIGGSKDKLESGSLNKVVEKIRAAGFTISVDDFGIRFANLSLLIALDCDKLKVDRSLVEDVTTNPKAQSVLKALAALGAATGTKTTVEGIETEEQLSLLKTMGFDEMQGYLISQPLSAAEFEERYLR